MAGRHSSLDISVARCIKSYPSLFRDYNYERSRIKVLDHYFLVNGNGYEWFKGRLRATMEKERKWSPNFRYDYFRKDMNIKTTVRRPDGSFHMSPGRSGYDWMPYAICEYAKIVNLPDDIRPDWLKAARELHDAAVAFYEQPAAIVFPIIRARLYYTEAQASTRVYEQLQWLKKANARIYELEYRDLDAGC